MDFAKEVERLTAELRKRDTDPAYDNAPIEDAYARISHVNKAADGDKPIVQLYFVLQSMMDRKVRLGVTLEDTNRSAWKEDGERPSWDAIVERLVSGASHGVASTMLDRMFRQSWTLETLLREHKRAHGKARGFTLYDVAMRKTYATNNIDDVDALKSKVQKAQYDSEIKSAKICLGNSARRLSGNGRNGAAPFGHRWQLAHVDDAQLAAERAAIRWGIHAVTDGKSWGYVARRWNADGVLPRRTRRHGRNDWHAQNVRACLTLPRHAGLLVHAGDVVGSIVDGDGPIVSLAEWRAFEAVVGKRTRGRRPGDVESRYYASGTAMCGGTREDGTPCETPLVGTAQSGTYADGERRYGYKCPPRGCRTVCVDGRATEGFASDLVAKAIVTADNVGLLAHVGHSDRLSELDKLIADAEAAVVNVERQHDAARADRRPRLAARLEAFERDLSKLLDERDELREQDRQSALRPSDVAELCELWNSDATPADTRRTIMRQCVPNGFYVKPVGRSARLRGEQIFTRFYLP